MTLINNYKKPLIAHVLFRLGTGGLENGVVNLINTMPDEKYQHVFICMTDYTDFRNRIKKRRCTGILSEQKAGKRFCRLFPVMEVVAKNRA